MQTTPEYQAKMLKRALLDVCQVLREHPLDMDWHYEDMERIAILAGGRDRDPPRLRVCRVFLTESQRRNCKGGGRK